MFDSLFNIVNVARKIQDVKFLFIRALGHLAEYVYVQNSVLVTFSNLMLNVLMKFYKRE